MDVNLQPKKNIAPHIAYPKSWQDEGKWNEPRAYKRYPLQPQVPVLGKDGKPTGKLEPIGGALNPLTFQNAREEADYLTANPEMAKRIAEGAAMLQSPTDKLVASNQSLAVAAERIQNLTGERNALEGKVSEQADQIRAMQAELEAARAQIAGAGPQVTQDNPGEGTTTAPRGPGRPRKVDVAAARAAGAGE